MSALLDCLKGRNIPKGQMAALTKEYDEFLAQANGDDALASRMMLDEINTRINTVNRSRVIYALKYNQTLTRLDRMLDEDLEAFNKLGPVAKGTVKALFRTPTYARTVGNLLQQADNMGMAEVKSVMGRMTNTFENLGLIKNEIDGQVMLAVLKGIGDPGSITDPVAKSIAREFSEAYRMMLREYRSVGGIIGNVENYYPVFHARDKMIAAGKEQWKAAYNKMQDWDNTVDNQTGKTGVSPERANEIMDIEWETITTGGTSKKAYKLSKDQMPVGGAKSSPDLYSRRMQSRVTRPKNVDAYIEYLNQFGPEADELFGRMINGIQHMAHDTGVMRTLGPMANDFMEQIKAINTAKGGTSNQNDMLDGMSRALTGSWDGTSDAMVSRVVFGMQHLRSASLLGSAPIPALADGVFKRHTRQMFGLLTGPDSDMQYLKTGFAGMTPDDALRELHIMEAFTHSFVNRFDAGGDLPVMGGVLRTLNRAKNLNHRASRLHAITMATGDSVSLDFASTMGKLIDDGTSFADIDSRTRRLFDMYDLTEDDWGRLLENGTPATKTLHASYLPTAMDDIGRKISSMELFLRAQATNAPDLYARSVTSGMRFGARTQGGVANVIYTSFFQFKSFPMQVTRNHFMRGLERMAYGEANAASNFAQMIIFGAVAGAVIVQLQEMVKGNPLYKWDAELLARGFLRSGVSGYFGEFLLPNPDGYFVSLAQNILGPTGGSGLGFMGELLAAVGEAIYEGEDLMNVPAIAKAIRANIPGGTLWYLRPLIDRGVMDQINQLDPDYYKKRRRTNRRLLEERGATTFDFDQWNPF